MPGELLSQAGAVVLGISRYLFELLNGLAGRSAWFDGVMTLALESQLFKAGVIGGCFIFAWQSGPSEAAIALRRKVLLLTLAAAILAIGTTKTISGGIFLPRPIILAQQSYHLEGDRLVEEEPASYRVPIGYERGAAGRARGEIDPEDFESFPSDHAGFYTAIAAGIFMASRIAGSIALAWTFLIILGSRVVMGQHTPLDIGVGAAIGLAILLAVQIVARKLGRPVTDPIVSATFRYPGISSALLFLAIFEVASSLNNVKHLLGFFEKLVGGG